jgi:hypothetical protein
LLSINRQMAIRCGVALNPRLRRASIIDASDLLE